MHPALHDTSIISVEKIVSSLSIHQSSVHRAGCKANDLIIFFSCPVGAFLYSLSYDSDAKSHILIKYGLFRATRSPLRYGRRKTDVHWTSCAPQSYPTLNGALPRLARQSVPAKHPPDVLPFRGAPSPLHARVGVRPKFLSPPQASLCGDNYFWRFNHLIPHFLLSILRITDYQIKN